MEPENTVRGNTEVDKEKGLEKARVEEAGRENPGMEKRELGMSDNIGEVSNHWTKRTNKTASEHT